jgi:type III secretory pathway component EscT
MADMFLGITNRLAPNVQIIFLGLSIKSLLGLLLLWAGWFFILSQVSKMTINWLNFIQEIVQSLKSL